jgi:hypothetical protein
MYLIRYKNAVNVQNKIHFYLLNAIIDNILSKRLKYAFLLTGNATALPNLTKCPDQEYLCNLRNIFLHSSRPGNFFYFVFAT